MISKKIALQVLNESLKTGAEYAEIYQEETIKKSVVLSYKRVENVSTGVSSGIALRLFKGERQVFGYTSDVSLKSLLKLADTLSSSFDSERVIEVKTLKEKKRRKVLNRVERPFVDEDVGSVIEWLKKAEKAAYEYSEKVINATCSVSCSEKRVLVYNSDEIFTKDLRSNIALGLSVTAKNENGVFGYGNYGLGGLGGFEKVVATDIVEEIKKAAQIAIDKTTAKDSPSGNLQVVIGNGFGGTLFHEACGHPLEASSVANHASRFEGKIGEKIASDIVTAVDDGTLDGEWGSLNFDDEGEESTKNVLIENGILKNYIIDRFNGRKLNMPSTGSSRRESYKYIPTSRMTNTYIAAGKSTFDEIIGSVKYGIYCKTFRGGQVQPSNNNFNFSSDECYMIRDGKICEMIKPVVLVGYGYEVLNKIDMVGNDLALAKGMCGASSGQIPVQVGQPTVRISNMIVGGTSNEENI